MNSKKTKIDTVTETIEEQSRNTINVLKLLSDSTSYPFDTVIYLFKQELDSEIDRLRNYEGRWK